MKNYKRPLNIGQRKKCSWIHIDLFVGIMYKNQTLSAIKMKNQTMTNQNYGYALEIKSINQTLGQKICPKQNYPPPPHQIFLMASNTNGIVGINLNHRR